MFIIRLLFFSAVMLLSTIATAVVMVPGTNHIGAGIGWVGNSVNLQDLPPYGVQGIVPAAIGSNSNQQILNLDTSEDIIFVDRKTVTDDNGLAAHVSYQYAATANWLFGIEVGYKDFGEAGYRTTAIAGKDLDEFRAAYEASGGYSEYGEYGEYPEGDFDSIPLFHLYDSHAMDVLMTANYVWKGGFNLFVKAGVARVKTHLRQFLILLCGDGSGYYWGDCTDLEHFEDKGPLFGVNYKVVNYRPEVVIGAGWMPNRHYNIYFAFGRIGNSWGSLLEKNDGDGFVGNGDPYESNVGYSIYVGNGGLARVPPKLVFSTLMAGITILI